MNTLNKSFFKIFIAIIGLVLFSCKTETIVSPTPYADIVSFKVGYNNGKDSINAIIENNSIIINWPGMSEWPMPEKLKPKIVVSKNAKITPASDQEIELKEGLEYEVKAQDGTIKKYAIKLINTALIPTIPEQDIESFSIGQYVSLRVINLATDGTDKITLINDEKKEFSPIQPLSKVFGYINFIVDQNNGQQIPPGDYFAKVTNKFNQTTISEKKIIKINNNTPIPYPVLDLKEPLKLKAGESFIVPLKYGNKDFTFRSALLSYLNKEGNQTFVSLQILGLEQNGNQIKLGIPPSFNQEITSTLEETIKLSAGSVEVTNIPLKHPIQIVK